MTQGDGLSAEDRAQLAFEARKAVEIAEPEQPSKPALPVARCADCLYWGVGQCRRGPPDLHRFGARLSAFALTDGDVDWCGEFAHKTLGERWTQRPVHDPQDLVYHSWTPRKQWRFPTEPE